MNEPLTLLSVMGMVTYNYTGCEWEHAVATYTSRPTPRGGWMCAAFRQGSKILICGDDYTVGYED